MKVSWKKKTRWERVLDPITSRVKGRELTVNGRALTAGGVTKPAARVLGGLAVATVVSAVVSAVRGQDDE
jgi:hypothetical protein